MPEQKRRSLTDAKVKSTTTVAAAMFENYEKKILDLTNQLKFAQIVHATLDLEQMVKSMLFSCQGNLLVSSVAILLPTDLDNSAYALADAVGIEGGGESQLSRHKIEFRATHALVKKLKTGVLLGYRDMLANEQLKAAALRLAPLNPELLVPLTVKQGLAGVLILGHKLNGMEFTNSEYGFITSIAEASGTALENARLYELATLDRMSGLYLHHFFKNRLHEEFLRARRYHKPLSLIMCDIDHFKLVNDTHGHQKGDLVIQDIARILLAGIRVIDVAARYGGEEFAVILPETAMDSAMMVAERLREAIEHHAFANPKKPLKITASFGVAMLRKNVDSTTAFIELADKALYKSKKAGRNRVSAGN